MDAELNLATAPFRDPRYAPRRLEVERRPGGEMVLTNPTPYSAEFQTMTAALAYWAKVASDRVWLAERSGEGWRTVTFAEAHETISAIAGGLRAQGVVSNRPLLILAYNGIDHGLIAYAAMSQGMPIAPVSPQYGLKNANPERLTRACEVLKPAAVFTDDPAIFAEGLASADLAGLPVIAAKHARAGDISFKELLAGPALAASAVAGDHAKYLLTSGSTGHPKAVICSHANVCLNSAQIAACYHDPEPPVMVNSAPWSHSLGANSILHMSAHRGGTLYIDHGQPTAARFGETGAKSERDIAHLSEHGPGGSRMLRSSTNSNATRRWRAGSSSACGCSSTAARRWARRSPTASRPWRSARWAKRSASPQAMAPPRPGRPPATSIGTTAAWA